MCWKYGSIDVLEDDEGVVLDDIINNFLNTTDDRPRISMWYGKVNQHNENGTWMTTRRRGRSRAVQPMGQRRLGRPQAGVLPALPAGHG